MMNNFKNKNRGFSLLEVVVALGIFSIATTYALSIFVQSNKVQHRTASVQQVLGDARYVLEVMAREIRLGGLDYAYYASQNIDLTAMPLTQDNAILAVRDADNVQQLFKRVESPIGSGRYVVQYFNAGQWVDITPADLSIVRLSFYITPSKDPFVWNPLTADYDFNVQPRVTIVLGSKNLDPNLNQNEIFHLQTTVVSRQYLR